MCENNYCVFCGKKLKDTKKGYAGNNRRFHVNCEKEINHSVDFHNKCVDDYKDNIILSKKFNKYKSMKDYFNFKHKALKKTPNTEETREEDYNKYIEGQKWLMKKNISNSY